MFGIHITVRSLTYGQKGIKLLQKNGISASLVRAPKSIAANGCGYSILIRERDARRAVSVLSTGNVTFTSLWREKSSGEYEKVIL